MLEEIIIEDEIIIIILIIVVAFISAIPIIINIKARKKEMVEKNQLLELSEKRKQIKQKFLEHFSVGHYKEAVNYIEKYSLYGDFFDKEQVAYSYCMTGRYKQAINIYNRLLQTNPNNTNYKFNLVLAKYKLNPTDSKYLEELYNKEKPIVILKEKMNLIFNDKEQKEALKADKMHDRKENIFEISNLTQEDNRKIIYLRR